MQSDNVKQEVNFFITDLDDTLWDWLEMWYNSFNPYLERISKETQIDRSKLIDNFKELHQKYGTTEMSFAYKELPIIPSEFYPFFENSNGQNRSILHEYYSNKKNNLKLYDRVLSTLQTIKSNGTVVVAFTESYLFFTKYRIKHLGLDGLIDCIYSPEGMDIPQTVYKHYPEEYWEPQITKFKSLPNDTRKPNPEILLEIIADFKADTSKSIYIGDKLDRDVYMAQQANITSIHAKYGHIIDTDKYELLRNVTHWTNDDVIREKQFKDSPKTIKPDYEIDDFSEILNLFNFTKF